MKYTCLVILALFAVVAVASPAKEKPAAKCKLCDDKYEPVCGGPTSGSEKPVTFGSTCVLNKYNCETNKGWVQKSTGECPGNAPVRLS